MLIVATQTTLTLNIDRGGLPSAETIADVIKEGCSRTAPLMIVTDEKDSNLMCFQAVYLGVGYKPAKGAQEWRSTMGPFFGIMYNLIKACIWPSVAQVTGSLIMEKTDGEKVVVKDSFYWVIITHASPYNGVLTDDLWVSYMKLDEFPVSLSQSEQGEGSTNPRDTAISPRKRVLVVAAAAT